MKKILITNDDGITADGLIRLARAAGAFEGAAEGTDFRAYVDNCISIGIVRNITTG